VTTDLRGVDILIKGNRIAAIGAGIQLPPPPIRPTADDDGERRVIDASRLVVIPGMVNTHHHFVQTLTRAAPGAQDAKLFDWLVYLYEIWRNIDEESIYWSSRLALAELALSGAACSTDHHYLYPADRSIDIPALQFGAAADLGVRFAPTRGSMSMSKKDGGLPPDSCVQDEDRILADTESAIKKFNDPAPDSMRRLTIGPCSPFTVSESLMRKSAELGRRLGVRLHTHLAETADEDDFCMSMFKRRPLALMEDTGFIGDDVWYAHGIFFQDDELDTLAAEGAGVAHCPSSNMRLGSGICRVHEMLGRGMRVGIGVDGSASNDSSDMLGEVRQAMLLQRVKYGSTALSAREALRMASEHGARMLGFEEAGRIEEGWLADLALFDVDKLGYVGASADPVASLVFCGGDHRAAYVVVNGKVIVDKGRLVGLDEEEIRVKADEASRRLFTKAGIPVY
jgi:cytosine/adenosine deaminase-related metal-dependent hydrolase